MGNSGKYILLLILIKFRYIIYGNFLRQNYKIFYINLMILNITANSFTIKEKPLGYLQKFSTAKE